MALLERIDSPAELRRLDPDQVLQLATEIRTLLVSSVSKTGGHLGPNLGVVELTLALHRVFESPTSPIVFDTGHQAYVHKMLTGRWRDFSRLRVAAGLSGYPNRAESPHDVEENSHASGALAYADGLSKALALAGDDGRRVVAVVGDGALTGGLAWEALNNLGGSRRQVIVVLNDNGRSYSPTAGALPRHLRRLADRQQYADVQTLVGGGRGDPGPPASAQNLFEALGFTYLGPVDGHSMPTLEERLRQAAAIDGPVVVHCQTVKGRGYPAAENDQADHLHTVAPAGGKTGRRPRPRWTEAFSEALVRLAAARPELVAVTAAMLGPTGLQAFADRYPDRCFDVGIAEQHALTSAAGMAMGGLHPVVALYSTFANRGFDQALLDIGLHRLPVTLVLDRAGVTGPDGPSHHGMWDLALLGMVPGIHVAAPRDAETLIDELSEALRTQEPTVLRFPKGALPESLPAVRRAGRVDVLREPVRSEVLLLPVGPLASTTVDAGDRLARSGVECMVVDPRWSIPVPDRVVELARQHRLVVVIEDGVRTGGVGSRVAASLADAGVDVPVRRLGLPSSYLAQGDRGEILAEHGLDPDGIVTAVRDSYQALPTPSSPDLTLVKPGDRTFAELAR